MNYPNRVIKKKEKDKKIVEAVQEQLGKRGITNVAVDGDFGRETEGGVKLFQTLHRDIHNKSLEADGEVGPLTWESLFEVQIPVVAMTQNDLLRETLSVAQSQVGMMEKPSGSNRGKEVESYQTRVGIPSGTFWCAAFVYFCFDEAAKKLGVVNPLIKTGGCLDHWNRSKAAKIKAKDARDNPNLVKPGNVFIIDHGGGHGHTGIVKRVEGGRLITIEGNSNPNGSSNGIGVFELDIRKVSLLSLKGFLDYQ